MGKKNEINVLVQCPACGNTVSSHATACPFCGHPMPKKAKSHAKGIFKFLFALAIVLVAFWAITDFIPKLNRNNNKGAASLDSAVKTYVEALEYNDAGKCEILFDDNMKLSDDEKNSDISKLRTKLKATIKNFDKVNWESYRYDIGDEYQTGNLTCCRVKISVFPKGWVFENSTIENGAYFEILFHKADTPQGEKWFVYGK